MRRTCLILHFTPGSAFTEPSGFRVAARTSLYEREEPTMANLSQVAQDERTARMALSMIVEPDDAVTGRLLGEVGAVEVLRLAERATAPTSTPAATTPTGGYATKRSSRRSTSTRTTSCASSTTGPSKCSSIRRSTPTP